MPVRRLISRLGRGGYGESEQLDNPPVTPCSFERHEAEDEADRDNAQTLLARPPCSEPPLRDEAESTEMGKSHSHGWRVGSRALAATLVVLFSDRIIISCLVCTR